MKGLAAADITPLIGFAGFIAAFFFLTFYMQNVLGYSPVKSCGPHITLPHALSKHRASSQ